VCVCVCVCVVVMGGGGGRGWGGGRGARSAESRICHGEASAAAKEEQPAWGKGQPTLNPIQRLSLFSRSVRICTGRKSAG
jgi:hypothetical protein